MTRRNRLNIRLLGPLAVTCSDGTPASFPTQKSQALLAMIALAGPGGLHRDTAADLLWSRSGQVQARTNLRQSLASLRKALGADAEVIETRGPVLGLRSDAVALDVDALGKETPPQGAAQRRDDLVAASTLLAGLTVNEAPFEGWLTAERAKYTALLSSELARIAEDLLGERNFSAALTAARRLLDLDALNEAAHRLVLRVLHAQGETATALRHYDRMREVFLEDLGIQPGPETTALIGRIRSAPDEPATPEATPAPPVTAAARPRDKPSVAVLPFTNMSGDPEQDYFSDGITEDIITGLSRFRTLFVVARHSSFAIRHENLGVREIGQRLGVEYVVEGSVRRAGTKVRISVQLADALTGNHVWAERYDREFDDIFAVQDEVTRSIVAVLPGRVQEDVADRALRMPTENMKAYEYMLRGKSLRDGLNAEDTVEARELFRKALELDPRYARAYMYLADTYVVDGWLGLAEEGAAGKSLALSRKGAGLDNNDVYIQDQLGYAFLCEGLWDEAEVQFEKTLSKIVNEAESMAWCGYAFLLLGQREKALEVVQEAIRLDPLHSPSIDWTLGQIRFFTGDYGAVVQVLIGEALLNSLAHAFLVSAYAHLGQTHEADAALSEFIRMRRREFASRDIIIQNDTVESLAGAYRPMWRNPGDWEHLAGGLRKAGLPD
ncbi:BTAD domain-containing putative transcriptional regulator [Defluviimonas aestuarii]|uniref:BTAD domain-containing putative transcriptional regulator n=1 Tax=Albidovulum aestuarii TaxID=1130726 RepID=UPI00249B48FF|nr:BTAD domain-containing putative transcriptional regulator [Defluviimonas aestuarii]MDI3336794.1 BTAD domain-containing putative transcriptional regulator [Defluviimonas aestuarii]